MRVFYIHSNIVINMCICICICIYTRTFYSNIVCTKFSPFWIKIRIFGRILFSRKERTLGIKFNSCQMAALPFCEFQVSINLWKLPPGPPRGFDIACTIYILKNMNHYSFSVVAYLSKPCPTSAQKFCKCWFLFSPTLRIPIWEDLYLLVRLGAGVFNESFQICLQQNENPFKGPWDVTDAIASSKRNEFFLKTHHSLK